MKICSILPIFVLDLLTFPGSTRAEPLFARRAKGGRRKECVHFGSKLNKATMFPFPGQLHKSEPKRQNKVELLPLGVVPGAFEIGGE